MVAVALIGVDGAGKTTIARRLLADFPRPMKYVYMGTAIQSANYTLPTSRLILYLKRRAHSRRGGGSQERFVEHPPRRRGSLAAALSLCHQVAEEWYRQFVSMWFRLRGRVVLWDRYFLFEHAIPAEEVRRNPPRLTEKLHLWLLRHAYPAPSVTIFLDAPVEVLQRRKKEQSVERLRRHRQAVLEVGERLEHFHRIDATRTVDEVYREVEGVILERCGRGRSAKLD